jgi:5,5'-dehydrodivanillate O-demethylase
MLTQSENERLTDVRAGTDAGELLRRYWMPISAEAELLERPIKPVRLLAEDLVLFRTTDGAYGLVARRCPHRGTDLAYAMVEDCGIRCPYHGWMFDAHGACVAQPFEETARSTADFRSRTSITSYPVRANAGLLWAYLGPGPAPEVPNWRNFHRKGFKHLCFVELSCNWLQVMENAFDQAHNEWMHDKWSYYLRDGCVPANRWKVHHISHTEFKYGWVAEVQYDSSDRFPDRTILWPNYSLIGAAFEWVVPIDNASTLVIYQHLTRFYTDAPFSQRVIPYWRGLVCDATGTPLTHPPRNQDFAIWLSQGSTVDRSAEHLGASDTGIITLRKKLKEQIAVVASGGEPQGVIRNPADYFVMLPESVPSGPERDGLPGAMRSPADIRTLGYVAGFPEALAAELEQIAEERGEPTAFARVLKAAGWKVGGRRFNRDRHFASLRGHGLQLD